MFKHLFVSLLCAALISGCGEEIPSDPTWVADIEIMLTANCARCHGETKAPGVPPELRLDRYDEAFDARERIRQRAVDYEEIGVRQMPPDSYLTNDQKEILGIWIENGAPFE